MRMGLVMAVAACAALVGGTAQAKPVNKQGLTIAEAQSWLEREGFRTKVGKLDDGVSYVDCVDENDWRFQFLLMDCEGERCLSGQFFTVYESNLKLSLEQANDWNVNTRFVKAHTMPDSGPMVTYDITLGPGVTYEGLSDSLELWMQVSSDFDTDLQKMNPSSAPRP